MKATEMLMKEHRVIERMIGVLEAEAGAARERGRLDGGTAAAALSFIREYADGLHHRKEEELLFKAMLDAGFPREGGPVAVMLAEHDAARARTEAMGGALEGAAGGDASALRTFLDAAVDYAALMRPHILKEDQILYVMAGRVLAPAVQEALHEAFLGVDESGAAVKAAHEAAAERLGRRYGVEEQARPSGAPLSCGGF